MSNTKHLKKRVISVLLIIKINFSVRNTTYIILKIKFSLNFDLYNKHTHMNINIIYLNLNNI